MRCWWAAASIVRGDRSSTPRRPSPVRCSRFLFMRASARYRRHTDGLKQRFPTIFASNSIRPNRCQGMGCASTSGGKGVRRRLADRVAYRDPDRTFRRRPCRVQRAGQPRTPRRDADCRDRATTRGVGRTPLCDADGRTLLDYDGGRLASPRRFAPQRK